MAPITAPESWKIRRNVAFDTNILSNLDFNYPVFPPYGQVGALGVSSWLPDRVDFLYSNAFSSNGLVAAPAGGETTVTASGEGSAAGGFAYGCALEASDTETRVARIYNGGYATKVRIDLSWDEFQTIAHSSTFDPLTDLAPYDRGDINFANKYTIEYRGTEPGQWLSVRFTAVTPTYRDQYATLRFAAVTLAGAAVDTDLDGLLDSDETDVYGTDPLNPDTDGDTLSDGDEVNTYGTNPLSTDTDGDDLTDDFELAAQEFGCPDPTLADTDMDGLSDGDEFALGLDACSDADYDGDGLMDAVEMLVYGTSPILPDTDGDGLFDGTEVDMAQGGNCPDPLNPDSDGDTLSDGDEAAITLGTDPCSADTDGDTVPDNVDDLPTVPGVTTGFLEEGLRDPCEYSCARGLEHFAAPNDNARKGRRNALCNKLNSAAKSIAKGEYQDAYDALGSLLQKLDDENQPPDWMVHHGMEDAKSIVRADVELMRLLISYEL